MKLLLTSHDKSYLDGLNDDLREKGILGFVSGEYSRGLNMTAHGDLGLWVVLDEQYPDARACLNHPEHRVAEPLTEERMQALEQAAEHRFSRISSAWVNRFLSGVLILVLLGVGVYVLSNM